MSWATPPLTRDQALLFYPTLDDAIAEDHPIRAFDLILGKLDWSLFECEYSVGGRGRPPIHPRFLAGLIIYGLTKGVRSSRQLEEACENHTDIKWLMLGQQPDHSTICNFRTTHEEGLKSLFTQVCQLASGMGLIRLNRVALDGTTIRASSSRYKTLTHEKVDAQMAALEAWIEEQMQVARAEDAKEDDVLGERDNHLPPELQKAEDRLQKLKEAKATLEQLDEAKRHQGVKTKSQVPKTDPDSRILPNKDGGYAPNYTVLATVDDAYGFLLDISIIQGNDEAAEMLPAIDRVEQQMGQRPREALADGNFATANVIVGLEQRDVEFYSPLESNEPQEGNPAHRDDPTQPVAEEDYDKLPLRGKKNKIFDKSAFVYVPEADEYRCPMGEALPFQYHDKAKRGGQEVIIGRYQADPQKCAACVLLSRCTTGKQRGIKRDQYTADRERHATKMQTPEAKAIYAKRMPLGEGPFGFLKQAWNIRQFLLRGVKKVTSESIWIGLAFNMHNFTGNAPAVRALRTQNGE